MRDPIDCLCVKAKSLEDRKNQRPVIKMPALYYLLNILLVFTWPERLVLLLDIHKNLRLKNYHSNIYLNDISLLICLFID